VRRKRERERERERERKRENLHLARLAPRNANFSRSMYKCLVFLVLESSFITIECEEAYTQIKNAIVCNLNEGMKISVKIYDASE
jgi:hypothetical protein